jgi:cytochrome P450
MLTLADILDRSAGRRAPGPAGHPVFGSLPRARRDPLRLFLQSFREHGEVVRFRFGPKVAHLISSPEGVNHILAENNKNYGKQTRGYDNLRYVLGNGLLTSEGETWKRQRRIAQPAFHKQRIAGFSQSMVRAATDAAASLEARRGQVVDIHHEMMRLTLRIVGETLLGYDPTDAADEVGSALAFLLRIANERSATVLNLPPVLPTRENLKFRRSLATLDRVVMQMIAERRKKPAEREDLLGMLMEARDAETGEAMDDRQLRDEVMTIFLAGHETTANALTFSFLLLARHPATFRELRAELDSVLGGRAVTLEDLPRLTLNRRVLLESMRLYPPAWMIARSVNEASPIAGATCLSGAARECASETGSRRWRRRSCWRPSPRS